MPTPIPPYDPRIRDAVRKAVEEQQGCVFQDLQLRTGAKVQPDHSYQVSYVGWDESLHAGHSILILRPQTPRQVADPENDGAMPIEDLLASIPAMIDAKMRNQKRLCEIAALHGIDSPIPRPGMDDAYGIANLSHLQMTRSTVDMLLHKGGPRLAAQTIIKALRTWHETMGNGGFVDEEALEALPGCAIESVGIYASDNPIVLTFGLPLSPDVTLWSSRIETGRTFPETVVATMAGRHLGELVSTGCAAFDACIIKECTEYQSTAGSGKGTAHAIGFHTDTVIVRDIPEIVEAIEGL